MPTKISEQIIYEALKTVKIPGSKNNVVSANAISGLIIKDGHIAVTIEIPPDMQDVAQPLQKQAEQALAPLDGVLSASVIVTAHNKKTPPPSTASTAEVPLFTPARQVIAVASGKGGVGKSTTAINLALALQKQNFKVGLLDADIYGPSLPRLIGNTQKPQMKDKKLIPIIVEGLQTMSIGFLVEEDTPTIWRGPMVMGMLQQMLRDVLWHELDILVVDMPPGTGDTHLSLCQRAAMAGAVIVSTPQDLALIDARKGMNMFRRMNVPVLGLIENMSYFLCPSCGARADIFATGGAEAEAARANIPFLGQIPLDMEIRETSDAGRPIVASNPDSPLAKLYIEIAEKVAKQLDP